MHACMARGKSREDVSAENVLVLGERQLTLPVCNLWRGVRLLLLQELRDDRRQIRQGLSAACLSS